MRGGETAGAARTRKNVTHAVVQMAKRKNFICYSEIRSFKCALQLLII